MQPKSNSITPPASPSLAQPASVVSSTWTPLLEDSSLRMRALEMVHLIAERLRDPNVVSSTAEQAKQQTQLERSFFWGSASFNHLGGVALLYQFLARSFPEEGWQEPAQQYLRLAECRSHQDPLIHPSIYSGSSGLALVLATFCEEEPYYQDTLKALNEQVSRQVLTWPLPTIPSSLWAGSYDVISGAAGVLGYLISLRAPTSHVRDAISALIRFLVWLADEQEPGKPNWLISPARGTVHERERYPMGSYNLGLAHGIPGPLAALALAWQAGYRVASQREAIERICHWIRAVALTDEWGINWPNALPEGDSSAWRLLAPTRAAWCYGAPGIASALRLAGQALADEELGHLAVTSLETVYRCPASALRLLSPTLCQGTAGLLAICLRFAQESSSQLIRAQIPSQVAQILAECSPEYPLIVRDQELPGSFVDDPSFLTGAVGVALVLLAASTDVEPTWDRALMLA